MEELRSTDALDKEIVADAKKKADRILAKAEESCASLLGGVDARVQEAKSQAEAATRSMLALYKKNINASLPLEKERYLVSYIHESVIEALNVYFESAGEDKRLQIVKGLVERSKKVLGTRPVNARVLGFEKEAALEMLKSVFGTQILSVETAGAGENADETVEGFAFHEGVILSTADSNSGAITCRLTLDEKVKDILDSWNFELSDALFGGRLPE